MNIDKLKAYRATLSQAEKDNLLDLARIASKLKREQRDRNAYLIKTEYLDAPHWASLASKYQVRMPHKNEPTSVKAVRKWLKKCNVPLDVFESHYTSAKYFVSSNAKWSSLATLGVILELRQELESTETI